ncbi:MAG: hypothetical protein AB1726_04830 [Planctomycetota bacterium]
MTSTIIARDATLAINGAPETRGEPASFLRERIQAISHLDPEMVEQCAEVLLALAASEDPDPEILEALTILGLSQPRIGAQAGVSAVSCGRRLASRLERDGAPEHAKVVLELLAEHHPGQRSLERDLAALMRRTGMVEDLVARYLERAQGLLREGRTAEAIAWYREVLLLDRSRSDVARAIRDLRYQEVDQGRTKKRRRRAVALVLLASTLLTLGVLREVRVRQAFAALPAVDGNDLDGMRIRLAALEEFLRRHPVWHGSLGVLAERSTLRVGIESRSQELAYQAEMEREAAARRLEAIRLARQRGRQLASAGDYAAALRELEGALRLADPAWSEREQVERDVEALRRYLEEGRQ